ncbi:hypothetical protein Taro_037395 [Colocasia esculenta]|uniref:Uncharacterized protein n=1 Tax=Colocasia esculenta TaxID=4460 RepID=A0A843WKP4_COLES|nr:hypothetical protein [Colocasia esculenta]
MVCICNDPTSRTPTKDPDVHAATHGSEDPEGGIPRELAKHNSQLTQVQELTTLALTVADSTQSHSRLHNPSDTELPR